MNHTSNYNLSQWEAGDRVQRSDFNADNAKIDAAIKAEASHLRLLKIITVPSSTTQMSISLSDLNLKDYLWLELSLRNVQCSGWGALRIRLNNISENLYYQTHTGGSGSIYNYAAEFYAHEHTANQFVPAGKIRLYTGLGGMRGTSENRAVTESNKVKFNVINRYTWGMSPQALSLENLSTINIWFESNGNGYLILAGSQFVLTGFRL